MNKLKVFLAGRFPFLLLAKAWCVALMHRVMAVKRSYSQAGEDVVADELLSGIAPHSAFYVDVGANHPTRLSNTYRLYRRGASGLVVEPNRGLLAMHRLIRPRDVQIGVGCGATSAVLPFRHAVSHVLSGFDCDGRKTDNVRKTELLPVLPLDLIIPGLNVREITLMSVDVEGFDLEVLRGARESLSKTRVLVVEGSKEDHEIMGLLGKLNFQLVRDTRHNLIFLNNGLASPA